MKVKGVNPGKLNVHSLQPLRTETGRGAQVLFTDSMPFSTATIFSVNDYETQVKAHFSFGLNMQEGDFTKVGSGYILRI